LGLHPAAQEDHRVILVLLDVKELGLRQQRVGAFLGPAAKHRDRLGASSAAHTPIGLDEEQALVLVVIRSIVSTS